MAFMIDGVEVAPPSLGDIYEWNRVSRSYNNNTGTFIDKTVAQKDKFLWEYNYITAEEMAVIENITKPKISGGAEANRFMVTSWTPDRGFVTKECYLGTPIKYEVIAAFNGVPISFKVSYHWIQISGQIKL